MTRGNERIERSTARREITRNGGGQREIIDGVFLKTDASGAFKKREKGERKGRGEGERERGSDASLVIRGKLFGRSISRRCLCETREPGRAPLAKTTTKTKANDHDHDDNDDGETGAVDGFRLPGPRWSPRK